MSQMLRGLWIENVKSYERITRTATVDENEDGLTGGGVEEWPKSPADLDAEGNEGAEDTDNHQQTPCLRGQPERVGQRDGRLRQQVKPPQRLEVRRQTYTGGTGDVMTL